MKRLNIETFIKRVFTRRVNLNNFKYLISSFSHSSLVVVLSLVFLSSGLVTEATAPTEDEILDHEAALEEIAIELEKLIHDKSEILWLARVLYSETKQAHEMPYIAWVVRNRVEIGHRAWDAEAGKNTYRGAALAKSQFSGMHPHLDRHATSNLVMNYQSTGIAWEQALKIAEQVYYSDGSDRVLGPDVTHFYSPVVISPPNLAYQVTNVHEFPTRRFAFYSF